MAVIYFVTHSKFYPQDHPSRWMNRLKYRLGDVVTVLDDVAQVGSKDLTNSNIKIVNIPSVTRAEAETWLTPMDYTITIDHPDWKRRFFRLDIAALPASVQTALTSNMDEILTINANSTVQELRDRRVVSGRWQLADTG